MLHCSPVAFFSPTFSLRSPWKGVLVLWALAATSGMAQESPVESTPLMPLPEVADVEVDAGHADAAASVRAGLNFHPSVSAHRNALNAALQDRREAWGGYLPRADLNTSAGLEQRYPSDRDAYWTGQTSLVVEQTLFDGFRTRGRVESQNYVALVRYHELSAAVNDLALQVLEARENVVRHQRLLDLARETYVLNLRVNDQVERRVSNGRAPRVDADQMAGRMALAESNLMTEAANLHDVSLRLQRLTGHLPPDSLAASDFGSVSLPADRQALLDEVLTRNPDFLAAIANVQVSDADLRVRESDFYPELSLRGRQSFNHNNDGFDDRFDTFGGSTAIELVLSYPLYRGGANRAAFSATLARGDEARDQRHDACLFTQESAQVAYNDSTRLEAQMQFLRRHQETTDEVRRAYRSQFDIGQRSLLEILDVETEYLDASRALINAEHDLTLARARTLHSMGELLAELGIEQAVLPSRDDLQLPPGGVQGRQFCDGLQSVPVLTLESLLEGMDIEPAPASEPEPASAPEMPAMVLSAGISFDMGSAELAAEGEQEMRLFAQQILSMGDIELVRVEGHTDSQGSDAVNLRLSEARAASAAQVLIDQGIPAERVESVGYGSSRPVADNETEEGRQANRRIEIRVNPQD